jgi:hypothetical protein
MSEAWTQALAILADCKIPLLDELENNFFPAQLK